MPPVQDAYNALQSFNSARPQATDYINQANDKYNVKGQQQAVGNLQSLVNNLQSSAAAVAPSVTGRTSGTFTTEGQRQALVAKEQQPILGSLNQQQTALGNAYNQQSDAETMANQMASTLMNQDQQKYQTLMDQYNASNAADQFTKQQQSAAAALAEQQRQYNATLAENQRQFNLTPRGGSGGNIVLGGSAPKIAAAKAQPSMSQKSNGTGFAFTNAAGQPISAATYAQQAGVPFGSLLQQMAGAGDTYAATAYHQLQKTNNDAAFKTALKGSYNALAWDYNG